METHARYIAVGLFTLIVAAAGFVFVYWLNSAAGAGAQTLYRVRFDTPVIGLRPGLSVLFNGLRVGEVRRVQFDRTDPRSLVALIAVEFGDARTGGHGRRRSPGPDGLSSRVADRPLSEAGIAKPTGSGEPPLLVADPTASASTTQSARGALNKLNSLLGDNSAGVHDLVANLDTFSQALGRNSGRVDTILAGLEKMVAPSGPKTPAETFDLAPVPNSRPRRSP